MASQNPKDALPISIVFTNLFRNLPKLILTNLLFAVPLAAFTALFWFLTRLLPVSETYAPFIMLAAVIPVFPFYAGIVKVTAKMAMGEENVAVFSNFFGSVRENFLRFLVHGTVLYFVVLLSYVSFNLYLRLISQNSLFMGPLIITILIILFLIFMFFYVPAMTVTFNIPMRYIYKNSFLMSYGELKHNFIGLLGLVFLSAVCTTVLIACYGSPVAVVVTTVLLVALIIPSVAAFIIHAAVYRQMYQMITGKSTREAAVKGSQVRENDSVQSNREFMESVRAFELDDSLPDDEYVYFNGKMVKKNVIKKLKREAEESEVVKNGG